MRSLKCVLSILSIILFLTGCSYKTLLAPEDEPPFQYLPYATPDEMAANFVSVWENRDIDEYGENLLYDGVEQASDGLVYESFRFYFLPGELESWGLEEEISHTEALFSGRPARDGKTPGVKRIDLKLHPRGDWLAVVGEMRGHDCPEGTLRRLFRTEMVLTLKSEGQAAFAFTVDDLVELVAIPVIVGDECRYRLWKWIDVDDGS